MSGDGTEIEVLTGARGIIVPPYDERAEPPPFTIDLANEDIDGDEIPIVEGASIVPQNMVTEHDEEIALVLGALAADEPNLAVEKDGLARSVSAAIARLGTEIDVGRIRIISFAPIKNFTGLMPAEAGGDLASRFGEGLANVIGKHVTLSLADMLNARLKEALVEAVGPDAYRDLGDSVMRTVTKPLLERKAAIADELGELLWMSYHEALRFQIGFTLAGLKDERDLASPFLELYAQGNFPIGYLADDSFLVIVA